MHKVSPNLVWRTVLSLLWLMFISSLTLAQSSTTVPVVEVNRIALWAQLKTLSDPKGKYTPAEVSQRIELGEGGVLTYADQSYGNWLPYPYWAEFELSNPLNKPQSRWLSFEVPTQDHAEVWTRTAKGWNFFQERFQEHPLALGSGSLFPVWRIYLEPGQSQTFLLRLDGYNRMRFPLFVLTDEAFIRQQIMLYLAAGFVFAVPCVIVVYVLTLLRVVGDKSIPLFLAIAACEMLGASWVSGLLTTLLPWVSRAIAGWLGWCSYVVMLGLTCWHAQIFMGTKRNDPLAHRVLKVCQWLWLIAVPLSALYQPDTSRLTLLFGGVLHAMLLTLFSVRGYIRKPRPHMALFIGVWCVYLASGVLYILYRVLHLPVYLTLMVNYIQGSLVAALLGWAVCVQVIARRQKLLAQIDQAHERANLYAAAQHDLWQPLQSVQRYTHALAEADESQRQKILLHIGTALKAVNDFMYALRDLWMPASPKPLISQNIHLNALLHGLVEEYRPLAQMKHINLRYRPTNRTLHTYEPHIQRILRNLITNALRYTPPGGRVLLTCRQRGEVTWLLCIDTGDGMSPVQAQKCFDAFTRFGDTQRIPEGMGLGLFSVRQLASAIGAQTHLRSREGHGTVIGVGLLLHPPFVG
jgi:signal transduction histidine kinase